MTTATQTPARYSADDAELDCADCQGKHLGVACGGFFWTEDNASGKCQWRLQSERQTDIDSALGAIPKGYRHCTLESFSPASPSQTQALASVKAWCEEVLPDPDPRGFYLHGNRGTGKTHLAVAALRQAPLHGHTIAFARMSDLFSRWMQLRYASKEGDPIIDGLREARVLVLDDLHALAHNALSLTLAGLIVNQAVDRAQCLLVTCQNPVAAVGGLEFWGIAEGPGDAGKAQMAWQVQDRLRQLCPWEYMIVGESHRPQDAAEYRQRFRNVA